MASSSQDALRHVQTGRKVNNITGSRTSGTIRKTLRMRSRAGYLSEAQKLRLRLSVSTVGWTKLIIGEGCLGIDRPSQGVRVETFNLRAEVLSEEKLKSSSRRMNMIRKHVVDCIPHGVIFC